MAMNRMRNSRRPTWLWFVCVVRVPLCVRVSRVSRVCPGSPRCIFTGMQALLLPRAVWEDVEILVEMCFSQVSCTVQ